MMWIILRKLSLVAFIVLSAHLEAATIKVSCPPVDAIKIPNRGEFITASWQGVNWKSTSTFNDKVPVALTKITITGYPKVLNCIYVSKEQSGSSQGQTITLQPSLSRYSHGNAKVYQAWKNDKCTFDKLLPSQSPAECSVILE